jgi:hypothetical protein
MTMQGTKGPETIALVSLSSVLWLSTIDWVSKKWATMKPSVFGAKFVAMKHGIEKLQGLCHKL